MNYILKNNRIAAAFIFIMLLSMAACKKYNNWEVDDEYNRLFRPTDLTTEIDGVQAKLRWKPKPATKNYTIEVSKDSLLFQNIVYTYTNVASGTDDKGVFFDVPDPLDALTRYSIRIKAIGDNVTESGWAAATFITATEQIMYAVDIADIAPRSVTLKWIVPNAVTHIMIGTTRHEITATERTSGEKLIEGLAPKTAYTALLYNNTAIRGSQTFSTKADIPVGPNVVEVSATDDLATMLASAENGKTYVLLQGSVYKTDNAITLPNNISITIWGEDGPQKPVLAFNGINLPANAGTIRFENLDITGYKDNDPTSTKRGYIFNQTTATATEAIIFENCTLRNFGSTTFRTREALGMSVKALTFNKCLVYDIGDNNANGTYAFIHHGVAAGGGLIDDITITNSTLYKIGYTIILSSNAPSKNIIIENNTFYDVIGNGRYFIDFNAQAIANSFRFNNNIIAKTLSPATSARGIRTGNISLLDVNNSYQSSDVTFTSNTISGITAYANTAADLFNDPTNGIFTFKDASFPGRTTAGDPRWR